MAEEKERDSIGGGESFEEVAFSPHFNPIVCRYIRRAVAFNTRPTGSISSQESLALDRFLSDWRTSSLSLCFFFFLSLFFLSQNLTL